MQKSRKRNSRKRKRKARQNRKTETPEEEGRRIEEHDRSVSGLMARFPRGERHGLDPMGQGIKFGLYPYSGGKVNPR